MINNCDYNFEQNNCDYESNNYHVAQLNITKLWLNVFKCPDIVN